MQSNTKSQVNEIRKVMYGQNATISKETTENRETEVLNLKNVETELKNLLEAFKSQSD